MSDWDSKSPDPCLPACLRRGSLALVQGFREHFPELGRVLDEIDGADAAYSEFCDRLRREAKLAGMGKDPWRLDGFGGTGGFAADQARTIRVRAMRDSLETPFDFAWHESAGYALVGAPENPDHFVVFNIPDAADPTQVKRTFEEFMSKAEAWPEAHNIRASWRLRNELYHMQAKPRLAMVVNTDPITSRCVLCGGSG